jgi:hypothetical protein
MTSVFFGQIKFFGHISYKEMNFPSNDVQLNSDLVKLPFGKLPDVICPIIFDVITHISSQNQTNGHAAIVP